MGRFAKYDLPYIGDKNLFAAVQFAGWLMERNNWPVPLAATRAAERYNADEKLVAWHVQNARIRASGRKRIPAV